MAQLRTQKRLLSMFTNKLEHIVSSLKEEKLHEASIEANATTESTQDTISRLEEGISAISLASSKVEKVLNDFASIFDSMEHPATSEAETYEAYAAKSEPILAGAFDLIILLQARLRALTSPHLSSRRSMTQSESANPDQWRMIQPHTKALELPPLPVPTYGENIWEWDNFWELFNSNIHSQDLPEMVKYNYLLKALKGEAKEAIKKFQVTRGNYAKAIDFLLSKYNNKDLLVNQLVEKLDNCKMRSPSVKDQRSLLEEIQAIVVQLQEKGEDVNSAWLINKVLLKFPEAVRRKVITRKQSLPPATQFTKSTLVQYLEEFLSTEEIVLLYSEKNKLARTQTLIPSRSNGFTPSQSRACMFCKGNHASKACNRYSTPQERSMYLRQNGLCFICASPKHSTSACKGRSCFTCGGAHHTSCCFKSIDSKNSQSTMENLKTLENKAKTPVRPKENATSKSNKAPARKVHSNMVTEQVKTQVDTPILQHQAVLNSNYSSRPGLPIGQLSIIDPMTRTLTKIDVLIDTGAEISFIIDSLAAALHLPALGEKDILINTFGSTEIQKKHTRRVRAQVWDVDGNPPNAIVNHLQYLDTLNISIPQRKGEEITPGILLGCDYLWSFMKAHSTSIPLPSGLHILNTKLGYLVTGQATQAETDVYQVQKLNSEAADELSSWDKYWSMNTIRIGSVGHTEPELTEEREKWEQYWALDAAGTEAFTSSEKDARTAMDKTVWEQFNKSIERRQDGYYVRLPWRDHYPQLPDNKALSLKRLASVYASLSKNGDLLEQYDDVFKDQLSKNIIEVVNETDPNHGKPIHYIPRQPVLTPQKKTTKLRVVFDASCHYKGCPSLNDVLHRGPVILPSLYGILLRFRIGGIAITSDIEKAFLQVRLQEQDRDATRCLWLRDYKLPPEKSNIRTFRFTRVTFGLKPSPFLLAGTTHYHLNNYVSERSLVEDIKANMYGHNLMLTTDDVKEAIHYYRRTKEMFRDLNMNLRVFTSNSHQVMTSMKEEDKSSQQDPKVLGIQWNVSEDTIGASCQVCQYTRITKRTVTSAIASIFDPLGWMVPLLHKAKVFLRKLWKDQHDWDTNLPTEKAHEWTSIVKEMQGFSIRVPLFLAPKIAEARLITFADASIEAIAACSYLWYKGSTHLLMAKSKLPSINGKTTIPKLELNAVTLSVRITESIFSQLEGITIIKGVYILSDSEIVLRWLKNKPKKETGQFITNRLKEILDITEFLNNKNCSVRYGHVSSEENPADSGTRGLSKDELAHHFWWKGPSWLENNNIDQLLEHTTSHMHWDNQGDETARPAEVNEVLATTPISNNSNDLLSRAQIRTFTQAKRILAYGLRFVRTSLTRVDTKRAKKLNFRGFRTCK